MDEILVEKSDGIAIVTINREEQMNSLNVSMIQALRDLLPGLDARVIIITGKGKSFIAGANIKELKEMSRAEALAFSELFHSLLNTIERDCPPVIAAINGYCLGGGNELAMACDLRLASENASFSQPEVKLGIIPGAGGTQRLPHIVGLTKAKELIYTGDFIDAQEAYRIGLVSKVVKQEQLMPEAIALAKRIMKQSHAAVMRCKQVMAPCLQEGLRREIEAFADCFTTDEPKQRITAFLEKRT